MKKNIALLGYNFYFEISKRSNGRISKNTNIEKVPKPYRLNFGPGPNWEKPDSKWLSVDIDPSLGDVVVNFQNFNKLPLDDNSTQCIYGSHVFEHMSIFKSPLIFKEINRVLQKGGILRLILPDAEKSIKEYVNKNKDFELFKRRSERAKKNQNIEYSLFECLREDFLSPNGQAKLLGRNTLAHQNAWDFETIRADLIRAGFDKEKIYKSDFQKSRSKYFDFEGTYPSEANEDYRSLYIEAIK